MNKSNKVNYETLLPHELEARIKQAPIAYIPLGTLEWHGPHMPLGADGLQSRYFFERLAELAGGVVLPMLYQGPDSVTERDGETFYGMDVCGGNFTGNMRYPDQKLMGSTYHIETDLFLSILRTLVKQLSRMGFRIIVAHGHGPSIHAFRSIVPEIESLYPVKCFDCWGDFADPDEITYGLQVDHGGGNETSIMLAADESLVQMDKLPKSMDEWPLAIGMSDPRIYGKKETGEEIIKYQLQRMTKLLQTAVKEI
jgi:creatinine amidohydrolase